MKNYLDKFSLNGKTAFVCGGTGLIGKEVCRALSFSGANTIILDIDRKAAALLTQEISTAGFLARFENFDVSNLKKMDASLNQLFNKYKDVHVFVNMAYPKTSDWGKPVDELNIESWQKNVDMHGNSTAWASRLAALYMKKRKIAGSIINFGSIYGVKANDFSVYDGTTLTSPMAYSFIKGGIISVSRYLASYFGKNNIRVNTICPGGIFDHQNKTFVRNYERKVPLRRMGQAQEIASSVVFLSSDASSYITGTTFMIDGGWTIV